VTLSVLFQCRWFCICFIQTWAYLWVICILMGFFRKYKWLFLVIKSVIKPWLLKKFSFALRAHIQRIDSYLSIYSCVKYKFLKNKTTKNRFELNTAKSACNNWKYPFFDFKPLKTHFHLKKKFEKPPRPLLNNILLPP